MGILFERLTKPWRAPAPEPGGDEGEAAPWGPLRRAAFRFAFVYLVLYNSYAPFSWLNDVPIAGAPLQAYDALWQAFVAWFWKCALGLPGEVSTASNGSGDRTYGYVEWFTVAALASIATLAWSLLDRRRANYARLWGALRVYVRYALGVAMVTYGMVKVIKVQFPSPGFEQLTRTYGESTPMGLLWTFMGYSTGYNAFCGAGELLGGLLLFFRRTTLLGALVVAAVMANVVALNLCYDVPVKIYSSHLLLMALFLLAPDARRLVDALVLGRAVAALPARRPSRRHRVEGARLALKALVVGGALYTLSASALRDRARHRAMPPPPETYGMFQVEAFERVAAGASPPAAPWSTLALGRGRLTLRRADGSGRSIRVRVDAAKRRLELAVAPGGASPPGEGPVSLAYERPDPEHLRLEGEFEGERVVVALKKVPEPPSLLMSRGFHWVNEFPYNR